MLFTWLMLAGLIIILAPHRWTNRFQFTFERLFRWPLEIGSRYSLTRSTPQQLTGQLSRTENEYENFIENLKEENKQLQQKIQQLSGLRNRFPLLEGAKLQSADVGPIWINDGRAEMKINRGKNDGLALKQYVMADNSIIGTISKLSSRTAYVKLFTDPNSKIKVRIGELEVPKIMQGIGNFSAKVLLVPTTYDVNVGDNVIACKEPGTLDVPLIIGKVAQRKENDKNPIVWDITVQPACEIADIESVSVLIMNPGQ